MTNERRLNHHILAAKISIMLVGWVDNAINIVMLITLYAVFISVKLNNDALKNQNIRVRSIFSLLHMPIGQSCSVFCTRLFVNKEFAVIKFLCQGQINSWLLCNFLVHPDPSIPYISIYISESRQTYKFKTNSSKMLFILLCWSFTKHWGLI